MTTTITARPHDGWRSRTLWLALGSLIVPLAIGTGLLFVDDPAILSGEQWIGLVEWLVLTVPTTYGLANVGQRFASRGIPPLQEAPRDAGE